jgi:hypothetical protein
VTPSLIGCRRRSEPDGVAELSTKENVTPGALSAIARPLPTKDVEAGVPIGYGITSGNSRRGHRRA